MLKYSPSNIIFEIIINEMSSLKKKIEHLGAQAKMYGKEI